MADLVLREYQEAGVKIFGELPSPARFFFAWDMGAGKTLGAISVARAYSRTKCLVVCPAIVREVWAREIAKHWPSVTVGVITASRQRKALTVKKRAELDLALTADVQIVSYDLVGKIDGKGWDMIIVDEFHNLRNPGSKQSKSVRKLFRLNPEAWGLGLSGTPIPNEAKQLWNPVDTFFPGKWGKPNRADTEPYTFVHRYCIRETNEYGIRFYGLKPEKREELAEKFGEISMRIVQADFAKYLPPLFVDSLPVSGVIDPVKLTKEWLEGLGDEIEHVGIYTHLRETAAKIAKAVGGTYITGDITASQRDFLLQECRDKPRSIVVGTTHALKEGVSLSFQKAALIVEWTTEVAGVVQFIGRFARQDSQSIAPTRVQFVVGPNDTSRAEVLSERIEAIQSVVKASRADNCAAEVFKAHDMSEEDFQAELSRLIKTQEKRTSLWSAGEDEDEDE